MRRPHAEESRFAPGCFGRRTVQRPGVPGPRVGNPCYGKNPMRYVPALLFLLYAVAASAKDPPAAAAVFSEDFEHFDRKNWDEFGEAPDAVEVVDGGRRGGKCVQITATLGEN